MYSFQYERNWQVHISRFEVLVTVLPLILFFWHATIFRWMFGSKILIGTLGSVFMFQDKVLLYADDDDDDYTSFFRIRRRSATSRLTWILDTYWVMLLLLGRLVQWWVQSFYDFNNICTVSLIQIVLPWII